MSEINEILKKLSFSSTEALLNLNPYELYQYNERLSQPYFTVSEAGMEHRTILHWEAEGIIDRPSIDEKWRRYSFFNYVWLQIVKDLRSFGVPIKTILELKTELFEPAGEFLAEKLSTLSNEHFLLLTEKYIKTEEDKSILLNKELMIEKFNNLKFLTKLNSFILGLIYSKSPGLLLLDADKLIGMLTLTPANYEFATAGIMKRLETKSIMIVNVSRIIETFLDGIKFTGKRYFDIAVLSTQEKDLLSVLRQDNIKEIKVVLKDGGDYYVEVTRKRPPKASLEHIQRLIAKKKFATITISLQNGEVVSFTETEKKNLK